MKVVFVSVVDAHYQLNVSIQFFDIDFLELVRIPVIDILFQYVETLRRRKVTHGSQVKSWDHLEFCHIELEEVILEFVRHFLGIVSIVFEAIHSREQVYEWS